ncbi:hypothetical protein [Blautia wexlerae]|uniref:hypothetical protein n=1 Tax=Blautia wexlerae TaxID=418240 RepID=UPI0034A419EA
MYATKYYYEIDKWTVVDTATYEKKKGKTETGRYEMDFSQWKELKKGEKIELKIDAAGFAEINQK